METGLYTVTPPTIVPNSTTGVRLTNSQSPELLTVGPVFCLGSDAENQESLTGTTNHAEKSGLAHIARLIRSAQELAQALEASNQRFLSVLPRLRGNYSDIKEMLPQGFQDRVVDRGAMVTGWIDQLKVLHHPSLCGFVSHCSCLSFLKTITSCVQVLTWPQAAEQHLNARFVNSILTEF
ncbi:protein MpUGT21 [Marchantia polymorpha subsp. ruderalis]|uniref:Uncharacterized protein n=2 Tax=Marchantia polymorpha TaxID=3197 RepID=A0AAF6BBG8_MARPO|nr:hypothetical protein MARPO_0164s0002 [Marchantia polymorpha]BBN09352.1 hypothetical protein Mp_4g19080 [Marchantia polymorpha subsp. ruderalis]|eukprot:PTQ28403.1 hypothetical protein MARPO_0164s0002 [Marchantia polymorpha]